MKTIYLKPAIVGLITLFAYTSYGQVKQPPAPNFVTPFQTKTKQSISTVVSPKNNTNSAPTQQHRAKIEVVNGSFSINIEKEQKQAEDIFKELNDWFDLSSYHSFRQVQYKTDELGITHANYQHLYKGFPVEQSIVLMHSKKGIVIDVNGNVSQFTDVNIQIIILPENAKAIAKSYLKVSSLTNDYPVETVIAGIPTQNGIVNRIAHKVRIDSYSPFVMRNIYVDANTGEVINSINLLTNSDVTGTGQTLYSGSQAITFDSFSDGYRLRESGRKIETYDATNATDLTTSGFTGSTDFTNSSTTWSGGNPALDIHWGMEKTYDFYLNVFNRNSFDNNGSLIKQFLNPPAEVAGSDTGLPDNAFAVPAPYDFMVYGMGDGQLMSPVVALDIEGHEFTHMVVADNGNGGLTYQGESGALNESFADIFGTSIEFYAGDNPNWTIGEDVVLVAPFYFRSMSNPNSGLTPQPDTYKGQYWANTANVNNDEGGVHTNSGVQNFWFYLLSQGGTGTNDLGHAYSVIGIGIDQARQIVYRSLTTYLTPGATYSAASNGSLLAAQDLFGYASAQYLAVRNAWYAVGIGSNPTSYCSGSTSLTSASGTVTDGGGSQEYSNNANCKWIIAPPGATQISLNFISFDTEAVNDIVYVYDGPDDTYPVLATPSGNTLPSPISTSVGNGAMCVKFVSNSSVTGTGWSANYTSTVVSPSCSGSTILSSPAGSFDDGSGSNNYSNNQRCYWSIAPPCATSVTLSFSSFNTELNRDGVVVYDDLAGTNQIAALTGTSLPGPVTSTTGKMLLIFTSDYSTTLQGFSASYTSTGSSFCAGVTTLNTLDYDTLTDGSGSNNYCDNVNCSWLIQPPQATSVTLKFTAFDLEPASSDGKTIYDAVEIYDGTTTSSPLLGRFAGANLPPAITSSGGSLLIHFYSDLETSGQGWSAYYTSTQDVLCSELTTLTDKSGSFSDGSGTNLYSNNSHCTWRIQPPNANSITLSFSAFSTELNKDNVVVYDGADNTGSVLGQFSGATVPGPVTSKGGIMYIEFSSDSTVRGEGWAANYTSSLTTGVEDISFNESINVFPNPTDGIFIVQSGYESSVKLHILDILGRQVLTTYDISKGQNIIDGRDITKGIYIIKFEIGDAYQVARLVIK